MSARSEQRRKTVERLAELEEVEVRIEKLVAGGDGFARFEGIPFFVPRAVPGDLLRVRLTDRRPDYARAEVIEVVEASPDRREAPCTHFDRCGGCALQQIEDRAQLGYKVAATLETLRRLGRVSLDPEDVPVHSSGDWAYRLRTQVHTERVAERAELEGAPEPGGSPELDRGPEPRGVRVGYYGRGSHDLVAVTECPVLVPELEREIATLGRRLPADAPKRIDLAVGDRGALSVSPVVDGLPHGEIETTVGRYRYSFDSRCFFQGHRGLLETLVDRAVGEERGELAVDLYSGVGLFSLALADRYTRVIGVESDRIAIRYAKKNARRAGHGIEWENRSVESWIDRLPESADRVLVDPPRSGLAARARLQLAERPVRRLTYVSCNAATLARDLGVLGRAYRVRTLELFDLFPQTGHMEVVAQLHRLADERRSGGADPLLG